MAPAAAASLTLSLPAGSIQILFGTDAEALRIEFDAHARPDVQRPVLFVEPHPADQAELVVDEILGILAEAALGCWPLWYGGADLASYRPASLHQEAARLALREIAQARPEVSVAWGEAAAALAHAGHPPRVRDCHAEVELSQLVLALNPVGLLLVVTAGPPMLSRPAVLGAAIEWITRHASVAVLVLCRKMPALDPALDRLLVGARWVENPRTPVAPVADERTPLIWLPPVAGRPHPQSLTEQRIAAALARDAELAPLFAFNQTVSTVQGSQPRVDLVWVEGGLVVELDGTEHAAWPKYVADRHRDYELVLSGYAVLRIANDEAAVDIARVVEKIRDMVRLRRAEMTRRGEA